MEAAVKNDKAETAISLVKQMLDTDDAEFKRKLREVLGGFAAIPAAAESGSTENPAEAEEFSEESSLAPDGEDDEEKEFFNDDTVAGLIIGVTAVAVLAGGGILLHKLLSK